ncbi:Cupin domain-containing protein [Asanoa hainanensis]|uniref:Cupin domain-containing protein n=1 Tax=Asanoa hainanensis TaxID=560556 RepID=A0A239J494_9ACTN|nr:cupin domain-containing protein [Asanoa hainanensis]SNT00619.1 Cupin domain-containing protein [Asanoa hainanensis]
MSLPFQDVAADDPRYTRRGAMFVPAGEGIQRWVWGDIYSVKATKDNTNGLLGFVEASVPPGGGPVAHVHNRDSEAFYVLDGQLEFLDGDETRIARSGDFVFVPPGIRHRFLNTGLHTAKMLFLFSPGGLEQSFVVGGDEPVPGQPVPAWDQKRGARMAAEISHLELDTDILP